MDSDELRSKLWRLCDLGPSAHDSCIQRILDDFEKLQSKVAHQKKLLARRRLND